jgi:penicillin-binding protein 1A
MPRPRPRPRPPLHLRRWPYVLAAVLVIFGALAGVVAARGPFFFMTCDPGDLGPSRLERVSYVYSADGEVLTTLSPGGDQRPVKLGKVSPLLRKATIAIEDRRFYSHKGIDYLAVVRAVFRDVAARGAVEGGSTITQQLARNLYLGRERSLGRKLAEGCLAVELERKWSKDRILETYLNTAYYGNGAYGIEAAARTYFSRSSGQVTLEQAALLAGLPKAPSELDPLAAKEPARARRAEVLQALVENGDISESLAESARAAPLGLRPAKAGRGQDSSIASLVLDELTKHYGAAVIRRGGLKVHTTIRARLQRLARAAIASTLDRPHDPAAAVVAIDPSNGSIRAVTSVAPGGAQFFNLAAFGRRQAGSAFKTFVLTEAVRRAVDPRTTTYLSAPFEGPPSDGKPWNVETYDRTYAGRIPIAEATLRSDNTVYARLTLDVDPDHVVDVAHSMGIRSELRPVPSIGLGTGSVSPLELASAYATLASGGIRTQPFLIRSVELPGGDVDGDRIWGPRKPERALPPAVAFEVTRILERNVQAGTGTGAQIDRPAAGKTGTTDDYADAWFAGYTPQLAAVVWVGRPQARVPMRDVHGIPVAGGTFPATIWGSFVQRALAGLPVAPWRQPEEAIHWQRWCGRYQYARTYRDARPEPGCPEKTTSRATTQAPKPQPQPRPATTQAPPAQPPPATTEATPPPGDELVGEQGKVTLEIDNTSQTGEVEVNGERYPAQSDSGEPIPENTKIEVVRTDDRFVYVVPE